MLTRDTTSGLFGDVAVHGLVLTWDDSVEIAVETADIQALGDLTTHRVTWCGDWHDEILSELYVLSPLY